MHLHKKWIAMYAALILGVDRVDDESSMLEEEKQVAEASRYYRRN